MKEELLLLNTKRIIDCDEEEWDIHNCETIGLIDNLMNVDNYDCAVICKYQDVAHKSEKQIIKSVELYDVLSIVEYFDCKNGVDLFLDKNGFINIYIYGQGYEYQGMYHLIEVVAKILPYDDNKNFLDLSQVLFGKNDVKISKEQFDKSTNYS